MYKKRIFLLCMLGFQAIFARQTCSVKDELSFSDKIVKVCAVQKAFFVTNLQKKEGQLPLSPIETLKPSPSAYLKQPIKPKWQEWP